LTGVRGRLRESEKEEKLRSKGRGKGKSKKVIKRGGDLVFQKQKRHEGKKGWAGEGGGEKRKGE